MNNTPKKQSGRPVKNIIPPIDATAENVAKIILNHKPKKKWDYLNKE